MAYLFSPALESEAAEAFRLIEERIRWMDRVGIRQWNVGGYTEVFPESYYRDMAREGKLYLLRDGENIAGAAVLLESDDRWDDTPPAYYVHNLVGSLDSRGAGGAILDFVEQMAVRHHKKYVRLDCSIDNPELNTYYEKRGYHLAGQCQEGPYIGNRRQKAVEQS